MNARHLFAVITFAAPLCVGTLNCSPTANDQDAAGDVISSDGTTTDTPIADAATEAATDASGNDAQTGSLEGTWRLVGYDTTGTTAVSLTDTNHQVFLAGVGMINGRANGRLVLQSNRIAFASALLFGDHVYPYPGITDYTMAFETTGGATPGTLTGDTFTPSGSAIAATFTRLSDGRISQLDAAGSTITWARADSLSSFPSLIAQGQATLLHSANAPVHPRLTLAWDLSGSTYRYTNDTALTFAGLYAQYTLTVAAAPAEAISMVSGTPIAIAYLVVYDDTNGDAMYEPASGSTGDTLRAISPIGISFRADGTAGPGFDTTVFRDLPTGFQYVHFHIDLGAGGSLGVLPYDPTTPVAPDVLVAPDTITAPLPDMIH